MTPRMEKLLLSATIQGAIAITFIAIERMQPVTIAPPSWLTMRLDAIVPFDPVWVWVYASWYLVPIILLALPQAMFRRASVAVIIAFVICAGGYTVLPVSIQRPSIETVSSSSAMLLGSIYAVDSPRNIFPSFHATLAAIVVGVTKGSGRAWPILIGWMGAVCLSCLFTKQHYILDVLAGL